MSNATAVLLVGIVLIVYDHPWIGGALVLLPFLAVLIKTFHR